MMDVKGLANVNKVIISLNDCMVETLKNNKIVEPTKKFMDFMTSQNWIDTVENGTRQEVIDALGNGMDPLTSKLMDAYGSDVAVTMPIEMIEWIKDTTILWIKNKGAGHTTTEDAILKSSQVFKLKKELAEMRDYYDR